SAGVWPVVWWFSLLGLVLCAFCVVCVCFFFQAEDGIRDDLVTGVQTCALPIYSGCRLLRDFRPEVPKQSAPGIARRWIVRAATRSEERRVGKECRSRWSAYD